MTSERVFGGPGDLVKDWIIIAAMSENRVIGNKGKLPWRLPEEFKWFKETTMGHNLVMGRKTYESIGRPLPGRTTIVLSKSGKEFPGTKTITAWHQIQLVKSQGKVFIAGGEEIYKLYLPWCREAYLTTVFGSFEGDTFFPELGRGWFLLKELKKTPEFVVRNFIQEGK